MLGATNGEWVASKPAIASSLMAHAKTPIGPRVVSALLRPFLRRLANASQPRYSGELTLPGLFQEVRVFWQGGGIPHVFAGSESDLFLAQGYLHAQERLWQMDLTRRFLSGRMAEILGRVPVPWRELTSQFRGRDTVDADYFMRLIGIRRSALASLELLGDDDRRRLEAYCSGVNQYIERCAKHPPLEFRLLRYRPDPWRAEDTLTIGKGFAFLLALPFFTRLNAIAVASKLSGAPELLDALYQDCSDDNFTITRALRDSTSNLWSFAAGMLGGCDWYPAAHGSNAWVIGKARSSHEGAILCNDPHLRMTLPPVWYLMHLRAEATQNQAEEFEVWGATVPGCPGVQVGHNRWIAWGVTAALCDDVELYREKINRLDANRYEIDGRWQLMERLSETIRVRRKNPVEKTVRWTRHGPVISDFAGGTPAPEALSLRWTAHEAGRDIHGLYALNRASNWDEFLDALSHQSAPTLNFVYADRRGNIGYSLAGKVPLRTGAPSVWPMEGWRSDHEWRGYVPFGDLPRLFNPGEGIIANANNPIADSAFPHYLSNFFEPPYRARRIHQLLAEKTTHGVPDMIAAQGDLTSLYAKELIATLSNDLANIRAHGGDLADAGDRLLGWNGRCEAKSVEAAIFHVFHHKLIRNLLIPVLGEELFIAYVEIFNQSIMPLGKILRNPESPWLQKRSRAELVGASLAEARADLTESLGANPDLWQWGKLHHLTLNHAFGRFRFLRPLLSLGPFASGGDNFTLNLGFYRHSSPYQVTVGPSMRMIVELADEIHSKFNLSAGQSGHVFCRHYSDQTGPWRRQEYIDLRHGEDEIRRWPLLTFGIVAP